MSPVSKLTRKFVISITAVLGLVVGCSVFLNQHFIQRYFLYQEKKEINRVCDLLSSSPLPLEEAIREVERTEDVVVAWTEGTQDNVLLNERLKAAFYEKGISLQKYWLWEQDQQDAMEDGRKLRIYTQEKLRYSLMAAYMPAGRDFIAVAKIIPSLDQTLSLVNQVTAAVFAGAVLFMFLFISLLVHRITAPLKAIGETARAISELDYQTVEVHTKDELEVLAESVNHMSNRLKEAHQAMEQKNIQMKELLANAAHDLKTPVALIQAYASGMRDGLDDGTFLDTIIAQNNRMGEIIQRLLNLAKIQLQEGGRESIQLSGLLRELIQDYRFLERDQEILFDCDIEDSISIYCGREAVRMILSNLFSNAVTYSLDKKVTIRLSHEKEGAVFQIKNRTSLNQGIDLDRLWEPFAVAEPSRNKSLSGTGMGLAMVKAACGQYGLPYSCVLEGDMITFTVVFPERPV